MPEEQALVLHRIHYTTSCRVICFWPIGVQIAVVLHSCVLVHAARGTIVWSRRQTSGLLTLLYTLSITGYSPTFSIKCKFIIQSLNEIHWQGTFLDTYDIWENDPFRYRSVFGDKIFWTHWDTKDFKIDPIGYCSLKNRPILVGT